MQRKLIIPKRFLSCDSIAYDVILNMNENSIGNTQPTFRLQRPYGTTGLLTPHNNRINLPYHCPLWIRFKWLLYWSVGRCALYNGCKADKPKILFAPFISWFELGGRGIFFFSVELGIVLSFKPPRLAFVPFQPPIQGALEPLSERVKLVTQLHLVPKLWVQEAVSLIVMHVTVAWCLINCGWKFTFPSFAVLFRLDWATEMNRPRVLHDLFKCLPYWILINCRRH